MGPAIFSGVLWILIILLGPTLSQAQGLKVTLLGTGRPAPEIERFGPSTLVEAGGNTFLFDCGRGVTQRLWQMKIRLGAVNSLFLTHLHSDHVVGIPDLWLTGWLPPPFGRRSTTFRVWGPTGTKEMMSYLERAYQWDIRTRRADEKLPESGVAIVASDIAEGIAYEKDGVKITAFDVEHGDVIKPAFGYRIDYAGRSVVISGDTRPSENLVRFAQGADVLIHEVAAAKEELLRRSDVVRRIIGHHTTPEQAGTVFARVRPKLAVYTHIGLLGDAADPAPAAQDLLGLTRKTYAGPLELGEDLMTIEVGDKVEVRRFTSPR